MADDIDPIEWILACVDLAGTKRGHYPDAGKPGSSPFRVLKHGRDYVEILHKESGAVWRFQVSVLRRPV